MPELAALASAAANICFASSSVRLVYVRGMSPHLNMARSYIAPPFREAPFPRVLCHGCLRRVVGYLGVLVAGTHIAAVEKTSRPFCLLDLTKVRSTQAHSGLYVSN